MSSQALRDLTKVEIMNKIEEYRAHLSDHTEYDFSQMRLMQGRIAGLAEALEILSDKFKGMFG